MVGRRHLLGCLAGGVLAPVAAWAQSRKPSRVAIISSDNERDPRVAEIRAGLQELGYVEGASLAVDARFADGSGERATSLARDVVASAPDVIVTIGFAVWPVKRETTTIPIVVAFSGDMLSTGIVSNPSHPGGNITGVSLMSSDLAAKRLQLLSQAIGKPRRVAVLYDPDEVATVSEMAETQAAARSLEIAIDPLAVRQPEELEAAFAQAERSGDGGLIVFAHAFAFRQRSRIVALANGHGLPTMYGWRQFVEDGGLMSYGPDVLAMVRRAARYVDRILRGTPPGDLPVEQPSTFQLVVNVKTAQAMQLRIAPSLLARADVVIGS